ncbi:MAG: hypothetical protein KAU23_06160, partial [Anaerolineales bacterium]|nr:hypothetical protein [Anaerolineales bacterium]
KQYHACAQILESELGVSPTPETISLFEQIKQWEFAEDSERKPSKLIEGEEASLNFVEPKSKTRRRPNRWVMGFSLGSLIVLAGFIYAQWSKDNQGALTTIPENTSNTSPEELTQNTIGSMKTAQNGTSSGETIPGIINPSGLLPSEACLSGERLVYFEDFQDNQAQGWPEIEYRAQNWDIVTDPVSAGNLVIQNPGEHDTQIVMQDISFDNAVWRINFLTSREPSFTFHWHWVSEPYESEAGTVFFSVYSITLLDQSIRICRGIDPYPGVVLADYPLTIEDDKWHEIEISTYKDVIEVWIDGIQVLEYQDLDPLPGGQLGLELWKSQDEDSIVYF